MTLRRATSLANLTPSAFPADLPQLPIGTAMDPRMLTQAACGNTPDPDVFFPEPDDTAATERAKAICAGCPVRARCLEWAKTSGDKHAILGGMTPMERAQTTGRTQAPPLRLDVATVRAAWHHRGRQHARAS